MFPMDEKFFAQFAFNPATFLNQLANFQRANFEAARRITETNTKAFQQLASVTDPQALIHMQPAILQAAMEDNIAALTDMWKSVAGDGK